MSPRTPKVMRGLRLEGVAIAMPTIEEGIGDWSRLWGEKLVSSVSSITGITAVRRSPPSHSLSSLAVPACNEIFDNLALKPEDVDAIVVATQTGDFRIPAMACVLQSKLGLRKNVYAIDINYGCSGYIYALHQAQMLLNSGLAEKVLVLSGDIITRYLKADDHAVRMVFGDACAATLVSGANDYISHSEFYSDGSGAEDLIIRYSADDGSQITECLEMNGMAIMSFAVSKVPKLVKSIEAKAGKSFDRYFFHQANEYMVRCISKKLKLSEDVAPVHVEGFGNTGPASIPLAIAQERALGRLKDGLLVGFGVGLSWAGISCDLSHLRYASTVNVE